MFFQSLAIPQELLYDLLKFTEDEVNIKIVNWRKYENIPSTFTGKMFCINNTI